jgi:hypothetical protein
MKPHSEEIVCDNSMRFSEGTFIRTMVRIIMKFLVAKSQPTAEGRSEVWIHPLITVGYIDRKEQQKSMK